jgi:hypothetical protein
MLRWITNLTYKIECKATKAGVFYQVASGYYRDIIQREAVLANITDKDHILCIGGGICPFSAILFHQVTGAKVTVIDNNATCIPKAKQVLNKLGIGDKVQVFHRDGSDTGMDLSKYSVIHLALQVAPMDYVFSQLVRQAMPGNRLLIRRPRKSLGSMYSELLSSILSSFPYVAHKSRNIGSTLLYIKQEQLYEEKMDLSIPVGAVATDYAISA